jgi:hypothetical protein
MWLYHVYVHVQTERFELFCYIQMYPCPLWALDWWIDILIIHLIILFYVLLRNFSLIWRRHHCRWRAAKFRPTLGAQGLWAGRDLYRATPAVTRDLGFSGLIRRTAPFSRLLRHAWGCGGPILARILTGKRVLLLHKKSALYNMA